MQKKDVRITKAATQTHCFEFCPSDNWISSDNTDINKFILTLSVFDEGYSRNASCALILIFITLKQLMKSTKQNSATFSTYLDHFITFINLCIRGGFFPMLVTHI